MSFAQTVNVKEIEMLEQATFSGEINVISDTGADSCCVGSHHMRYILLFPKCHRPDGSRKIRNTINLS